MDKCVCCEGSGKVNCKACNGEGKTACSACGGSGREVSVCPTCTKGYVPDPRSFDDEATLVCPDCHGEWQKDIGPCKECKGTGKVPCTTCEGSGVVECDVCNGTGHVDIEAMCKSVINIAEERCDCNLSCGENIYKDRITTEMAFVIFVAADKGVSIAAYVAAWLCEDYDFSAEGKDALDYLYEAANNGNMIAQYMCAARALGEEEWSDYEWNDIKKSAEQGFVPALEALAADYYRCDTEEHKKDLDKALECWKKILALRNNDAWNEKTIKMAELHVKYLPAIIKNDYDAMIDLGKSLIKLQPEEQDEDCPRTLADAYYVGRAWLSDVTSAHRPVGASVLRRLADFYWERGEYDDANEMYKKLADEGDVISQTIFGERLRKGGHVEKDCMQAMVYLYRAAEKGSIEATRKLAHMYRDGDYVEKNRANANELYVRAAKAGDGWALYEIGRCYLEGKEVKKDETEAKRLLTLAVKEKIAEKEAKELLAKIPTSVKDKDKGPSGIIVGKPDQGSLPRFLKKDYEQAVAGKPALTTSNMSKVKKVRGQGSSTKKRWKFVVLGLLFGFLGVHLAYAKRWLLFLLLWAGFIAGNVMSGGSSKAEQDTANVPKVTLTENQEKKGGSPIRDIGFAVWALLWIGGTLFIKKDGKGNRM